MKREKKPTRIGQRIYELREDAGLSTYRLAKDVGIHQSTMVDIQTGAIRQPRPDTLARIADVLQVSESELLAIAGYHLRDDLPEIRGYLNLKYRSVSQRDVEALASHLDYLLTKSPGATGKAVSNSPRKGGRS